MQLRYAVEAIYSLQELEIRKSLQDTTDFMIMAVPIMLCIWNILLFMTE